MRFRKALGESGVRAKGNLLDQQEQLLAVQCMKVGILTFHRALNYGAVLQAFALKEYLGNLGHDVSIVDYWPDYHKREYDIFNADAFRQVKGLRKVRYLAGFLLSFPKTYSRKRKFEAFLNQNLNVGDNPCSSNVDCEAFDVVIVGSDQVWRKAEGNSCDTVYLGRGVAGNTCLISYAASMGVLDERMFSNDVVLSYLKKFNAISVREKDLIALIEGHGIAADLVMDPVFLLSEEEWCRGLSVEKKAGGYVLLYHHNPSQKAKRLAERLAESGGLDVVEVNSFSRDFSFPFNISKRYHNNVGPKSFVELICNASYVVTTSFHGAAFSIIFKKNFYALGMDSNYSRIQTLLESSGLMSRYVEGIPVDQIGSEPLDFSQSASAIEGAILHSKAFLNQAFSN